MHMFALCTQRPLDRSHTHWPLCPSQYVYRVTQNFPFYFQDHPRGLSSLTMILCVIFPVLCSSIPGTHIGYLSLTHDHAPEGERREVRGTSNLREFLTVTFSVHLTHTMKLEPPSLQRVPSCSHA
jgi:hypothetical protein